MSEKSLLDQWRGMAYDQTLSKDQLEKFWANYFLIEKGIYEKLLADPDTVVKGTVKELAEKYGQDVMTMVGFLDGINDSLVTPNPIETMTEDTEVSLAFDKESLYKNMVDAKADWLYELPQWEAIFDEETRKKAGDKIIETADNVERENAMESLAQSKGYNEICVFMDEGTANIMVRKADFGESDIVKLTEMATETLNISANNIKIVEVR